MNNRNLQFSCLVVSNSLRPRGQQHARPPCPSPTPRAYSNSCPSSQWCHPAISSSVVPFSSSLHSFSIRVSANESVLHIRWPKDWSFSFSISSSNKHPGLISFRMDWSHHFMANGWGNKQWLTLFFWTPKSLQMVIAAMKVKGTYSLQGKLWPT